MTKVVSLLEAAVALCVLTNVFEARRFFLSRLSFVVVDYLKSVLNTSCLLNRTIYFD